MQHLLEYFGVITGLLYLLLEIRQHKAMWIVGFLTSLVYVFVFFFSKIYADMGLNIYYVAISIYGFWKWAQTSKTDNATSAASTTEKPASEAILYRHITWPLFAGIILAITAIYAAIYYILHDFTDSPIPMGDAFTTSVGIVATWMLARRIIEHWIFWVVVNCVSVYLYYIRGLHPTMFLYLCYALLAIAGYITWKKKGIIANETII